MNDTDEAIIPTTIEEHDFKSDVDELKMPASKETVSEIQTELSANSGDSFVYCGISPSSTPFSPIPEQKIGMEKLRDTVHKKRSGKGLMNFPPNDVFQPIS